MKINWHFGPCKFYSIVQIFLTTFGTQGRSIMFDKHLLLFLYWMIIYKYFFRSFTEVKLRLAMWIRLLYKKLTCLTTYKCFICKAHIKGHASFVIQLKKNVPGEVLLVENNVTLPLYFFLIRLIPTTKTLFLYIVSAFPLNFVKTP